MTNKLNNIYFPMTLEEALQKFISNVNDNTNAVKVKGLAYGKIVGARVSVYNDPQLVVNVSYENAPDELWIATVMGRSIWGHRDGVYNQLLGSK